MIIPSISSNILEWGGFNVSSLDILYALFWFGTIILHFIDECLFNMENIQ